MGHFWGFVKLKMGVDSPLAPLLGHQQAILG